MPLYLLSTMRKKQKNMKFWHIVCHGRKRALTCVCCGCRCLGLCLGPVVAGGNCGLLCCLIDILTLVYHDITWQGLTITADWISLLNIYWHKAVRCCVIIPKSSLVKHTHFNLLPASAGHETIAVASIYLLTIELAEKWFDLVLHSERGVEGTRHDDNEPPPPATNVDCTRYRHHP